VGLLCARVLTACEPSRPENEHSSLSRLALDFSFPASALSARCPDESSAGRSQQLERVARGQKPEAIQIQEVTRNWTDSRVVWFRTFTSILIYFVKTIYISVRKHAERC
jgi:hypothetical protein